MCAGWLNWQCQWDAEEELHCTHMHSNPPRQSPIDAFKTFVFYLCFYLTFKSNAHLFFHRRIGLLVFGWPSRAFSTSFKSKESEKNTIHNNNNNHNKPLSSVLLTSFSVHSRRTSRIYSLIWVNNTKIDKNRHAIP